MPIKLKSLASITTQLAQIGYIPGTDQNVTLNSDGTIQKIEHVNSLSSVLRTDTFTYTANTITEVRTLASGPVLTLVHHLDTLQTEVN